MDLFRWLRGSSNHELKLVDKSEVPLIDISAFKERIAHLQDLDDEHKKRLEDRWLHMVRWWDQRSTESKWKYQLLRVTVLIGGVLIPMLVSLQTSTLMAKHTDAIQLLAILMSRASK